MNLITCIESDENQSQQRYPGRSEPKRCQDLLDCIKIQQANIYADKINITDGKPKYLVVIGAKDVETLVSIPKFSEHQVTVTIITIAAVKTLGFTTVLGGLEKLSFIV
jgi:hypothetical protein